MFGGIYFGEYWPEQSVAAGGTQGPDPGGGEKRRKRKPEDEIWPQPWQYPEYQKKSPPLKPSPLPVEVTPQAAPSRPIAVVLPSASRETKEALASGLTVKIIDPAIAAKAAEMRRRLQRELEDEEILLMMGFFD